MFARIMNFENYKERLVKLAEEDRAQVKPLTQGVSFYLCSV